MSLSSKIIALISLIASIFGMIYGLMVLGIQQLSSDEIKEVLTQQGMAATDEMLAYMFAVARNGLYLSLFNLLEAIGVAMLLRGNFVGFHLYAASQVGLAGVFWIAVGANSLVYAMWCLVWILIYRRMAEPLSLNK